MAAPVPGPPSGGQRTPHVGGVIPAEWPAQAADTIVDTITKVRDKTTKPAIVAARAVVYGLFAAIIGTVAFIIFMVGLTRFLDNYLPGEIWTIYAGYFAIFSAIGMYAHQRANRPAAELGYDA